MVMKIKWSIKLLKKESNTSIQWQTSGGTIWSSNLLKPFGSSEEALHTHLTFPSTLALYCYTKYQAKIYIELKKQLQRLQNTQEFLYILLKIHPKNQEWGCYNFLGPRHSRVRIVLVCMTKRSTWNHKAFLYRLKEATRVIYSHQSFTLYWV